MMGEWFDSAREIAQWVLIIALVAKTILLDRRVRELESTGVKVNLSVRAIDDPAREARWERKRQVDSPPDAN